MVTIQVVELFFRCCFILLDLFDFNSYLVVKHILPESISSKDLRITIRFLDIQSSHAFYGIKSPTLEYTL